MTRKEIYNKIKELNLTQMCIEVFGKNMTICKNEQLLQLIEVNTKPKQVDTNIVTLDSDIVYLNEYFGTNLQSLDMVDWKYVSKCKKLNEDFIVRFAKYLDWDLITQYQQNLSKAIIYDCMNNDKYIINIIKSQHQLNFDIIKDLYESLENKQSEFLTIILERQILSEYEIRLFMNDIFKYCMEIKPQVWKRSFSKDFIADYFTILSDKFNMTFFFQQNSIAEYLLQDWLLKPRQSNELYALITTQQLSTMFLHRNFSYFNIMDIIKHQTNAQAFFDIDRIIIVNTYKYLLAEMSSYITIDQDLLTHLIKK